MLRELRTFVWLAALCLLASAGCTRQSVPPPQVAAPPPPPLATAGTSDHARLEQALQGRGLSPEEAFELSERMLVEGSSNYNNEETMARLELLLLKALQNDNRISRAGLLRNLGIIHYHQKQYKRARQELQASNELNPRDARTHFYLARLFAQQEQYYLGKGMQKKAQAQAKLAQTELDLARKLEPGNPLYRQGLQATLRQEQVK
ncbi:MAG: hypothetical protein QME75_09670 [Deltaproteobacteria bacterium]|nr:hypothetical protein [Deltaproteobacteria bacterium]